MSTKINFLRVAVIVLIVSLLATTYAWHLGWLQPLGIYRPSNSIMVVQPYRFGGTWVIDDVSVGLKREPFVSGIPEMIDGLVKDMPDAEHGFRLLFASKPFPGYAVKLSWEHGDESGNWYYCEQLGKEGWLCPALFKYYQKAPVELYVKAEK